MASFLNSEGESLVLEEFVVFRGQLHLKVLLPQVIAALAPQHIGKRGIAVRSSSQGKHRLMGGRVGFQNAGQRKVPRDLQVHLVTLNGRSGLFVYVCSLHAGNVKALLGIRCFFGSVIIYDLPQTGRQLFGVLFLRGVCDLIQRFFVLDRQNEPGAVVLHIIGGIHGIVRPGSGIEVPQPVRLIARGIWCVLGPADGDHAVNRGIRLCPAGTLIQNIEAEVRLLLLVFPHHTGGILTIVVIQHGHRDDEIIAPVFGNDPMILFIFGSLVRGVLRIVGPQAGVLLLEVDRDGGVSCSHLKLHLIALSIFQDRLVLRIPLQDEVHGDVICSHIYLFHFIARGGLSVHAQGGTGRDRVFQGLRQLRGHSTGGLQSALNSSVLVLVQFGNVVLQAVMIHRFKGQLFRCGRFRAEANFNGYVAAGSGRLHVSVACGAVTGAKLRHGHRDVGTRPHRHDLHVDPGLCLEVHFHLMSRLDLRPIRIMVHSGIGGIGHSCDLILAVCGVYISIVRGRRGGHKTVCIALGSQYHIDVHVLIRHNIGIYIIARVVGLNRTYRSVGILCCNYHLNHPGPRILRLNLGGNGLILHQVGQHILDAIFHLVGDKTIIRIALITNAQGGRIFIPAGHLIRIRAHHMESGGQSSGAGGHKVHMNTHISDGIGGRGHGEFLDLTQRMIAGIRVDKCSR